MHENENEQKQTPNTKIVTENAFPNMLITILYIGMPLIARHMGSWVAKRMWETIL